jgi:ubiquinone/menaquinone biosynthesis C-methylase UbiE
VRPEPASVQKDRIRAAFDRLAPAYDATGPGCFAHFGRRLVEVVGIEPGNFVLDVATGRGAVLFAAQERAGPTGRVRGIDLSEGMVRETNAAARRRGAPDVAQIMDAEHLEFSDASFDRVLCGFGVMFFPERRRAVAEFRRVLRTGGRVGISTWQRSQVEDLSDILSDAQMSTGREPGWIDDANELRRLLVDEDFLNVHVLVDDAIFRYADLDEYWQTARTTGVGRVLETLNEAQLERVRSELAERLQPSQRADGLHVPASALLATGTR